MCPRGSYSARQAVAPTFRILYTSSVSVILASVEFGNAGVQSILCAKRKCLILKRHVQKRHVFFTLC